MDEWQREGVITGEQRDELQGRLADPPSTAPALPSLWPVLAAVWESWLYFGSPCTVAGGGMTGPHLVDNRASLYPARVRWLDEEGVACREERARHLQLWGALDAEEIAITSEALAERS